MYVMHDMLWYVLSLIQSDNWVRNIRGKECEVPVLWPGSLRLWKTVAVAMDYPGASAQATVCPENGCATLTLVTLQRSLAFKYLIHPEARTSFPGPNRRCALRAQHVSNTPLPTNRTPKIGRESAFWCDFDVFSENSEEVNDCSNFYEGTIFPRDDIRENVEGALLKTSALPTEWKRKITAPIL